MKKIYTIILALLPLLGFSQWDVEWQSEQSKTGYQGDDVGFYYNITNTSNGAINVTWHLQHDRLSTTGIWTDYMCEGLFVCWPDSVRTNTFELGAGETIEMYHHIQTTSGGDSGTWVSTSRIWVEGDSVNTAQDMIATLKTGIKTEINGVTVYITNGDSFELYQGALVPLGINDPFSNESKLAQNSPNPHTGLTTIGYQLESGKGIMRFHDLTGKLVMELPLTKNEGQLTLQGELNAGLYFYSLWEEGKMIDSKRMQVVQ